GSRLTRFLGVRYLVGLQASPNRYPVLRGHPPRVRRGSPAHAALTLMRRHVAGSDRAGIVATCGRWYEDESEPHIYLLLAYRPAVEEALPGQTAARASLAGDELAAMLAGPLDVPDYAVDRHTSAGRRAGKTSADFAREGAVVVPEMLPYPELKDIYILSKKE